MNSLIVLLPSLDGEDSFSDGILIFGIAEDDDGTDAVVDAVIADAAEPTVVVAAANGAESPASYDDSAESEPLDLEAKPLPHVVILHDVDLVGDLRLLQLPRQIGGFRGGERVEIILQLLLIVGRRRRGRGGSGGYIIGGRGGSGPHAGGMVTWRSRVVDSDGWELRVGFKVDAF